MILIRRVINQHGRLAHATLLPVVFSIVSSQNETEVRTLMRMLGELAMRRVDSFGQCEASHIVISYSLAIVSSGRKFQIHTSPIIQPGHIVTIPNESSMIT